jgi:general secretion pathway protein C
MTGFDLKVLIAWLQVLTQPAAIERAARTTALLVVLLVAYEAALITWHLVPRAPLQPVPVALNSSAGAAKVGTPVVQRADLASLHLFGRADLEASPVDQPTEIAVTALRLELRGVLYSSDPSFARAIIADESHKEDFYSVEKPLPGGAVLKEIQPDRIILERSGRLETLLLPKDKLEGDGSSTITGLSPAGGRGRLPGSGNLDDSGEGSMAALASDGAGMRQVRDQLLTDPQSLMGLLQAQPETDAGKIVGYKLGEAQDPALLRRFGLRHGDVVTSVNGVQLDGPTRLPELLQMLPNAAEVRIEFKRRGRPRSVVLNMSN